jgi:hypothetical protein
MGTPPADFLTRAAVAASAPAAAAASSALVPRRWPFRLGSMPRQADDAGSPPDTVVVNGLTEQAPGRNYPRAPPDHWERSVHNQRL